MGLRIETYCGNKLAAYVCFALALVFLGVFLSGWGPSTYNEFEISSPQCLYECCAQEWKKFQRCHVTFSKLLPEMNPWNKRFSIDISPFNVFVPENELVEYDFNVTVLVEAAHNTTDDSWVTISESFEQWQFTCGEYGCSSNRLAFVTPIYYEWYNITVTFSGIVPDFMWNLERYDASASQEKEIIRLVFLFISLLVGIAYCLSLYRFKLTQQEFHSPVTGEYKWTLSLLLAITVLNNPIYIWSYVFNGWVMGFCLSFCKSIFKIVLLKFWLSYFDGLRINSVTDAPLELTAFDQKKTKIQNASLFIYAWVDIFYNFYVSTFIYQNAISSLPVGVIIFYALDLFLQSFLFFWVVILMGISWRVIKTAQDEISKKKFFFVAVPSFVAIVSLLSASIFMVSSPFNETVFSTVYFYGLFNVIVWLLAFAFTPSSVSVPYSPLPQFAKVQA